MNISFNSELSNERQIGKFGSLRGLNALIQLNDDLATFLIKKDQNLTETNLEHAKQVGRIAASLQDLHGPGLCRVILAESEFVTMAGGDLVVSGNTGLNLGLCMIALRDSGDWQPKPETKSVGLFKLLEVIARSVLPRTMKIETNGKEYRYKLAHGILEDVGGSIPTLLDSIQKKHPTRYSLKPSTQATKTIKSCAVISELSRNQSEGIHGHWRFGANDWPQGVMSQTRSETLLSAYSIVHAVRSLTTKGAPIKVEFLRAVDRQRLQAVTLEKNNEINILHNSLDVPNN